MLFCGIDTSNYTTSAALCDEEGRILANIKKMLPVGNGECGLRQSDAVFAHIKNLPFVTEELGKSVNGREITAVGVSVSPRNAEGSYMPVFLCGMAAAGAMCAGCGAPMLRFSHQQGHVMAAFATSGAEKIIGDTAPFLAFHVSGGTTELLYVKQTPDSFSIEKVGGTSDLNAGQAVDRVGVSLGMSFPCGMEMDRMAEGCKENVPKPRVSVNGTFCNLSGLQNMAEKMIGEAAEPSRVCAFVFDFIGETLRRMAENARRTYGDLPIVWAGGVMSNSRIKRKLSSLDNVYFTQPCYSSDNAAGTALLCRRQYLSRMNES